MLISDYDSKENINLNIASIVKRRFVLNAEDPCFVLGILPFRIYEYRFSLFVIIFFTPYFIEKYSTVLILSKTVTLSFKTGIGKLQKTD